jgi:hypothetical protein
MHHTIFPERYVQLGADEPTSLHCAIPIGGMKKWRLLEGRKGFFSCKIDHRNGYAINNHCRSCPTYNIADERPHNINFISEKFSSSVEANSINEIQMLVLAVALKLQLEVVF